MHGGQVSPVQETDYQSIISAWIGVEYIMYVYMYTYVELQQLN